MRIISVAFALLYAIQFSLLRSEEFWQGTLGPQLLVYFFVGALACLLFVCFIAQRRNSKYKTWLVVLLGLLLSVWPIPAKHLAAYLIGASKQHIVGPGVTPGKITDLYDDTVLSSKGNVIGIKIGFIIYVSSSSYSFDPMEVVPVYPSSSIATLSDSERSYLEMTSNYAEVKSPPHSNEVQYTFYLLPRFIRVEEVAGGFAEKRFCLGAKTEDREWLRKVLRELGSIRYDIRIKYSARPGSSELRVPTTADLGLTNNSYRPEVFFTSALKENLSNCEY